MKLLSIIVPVYNEQRTLTELSAQIVAVMQALADRYDYELILIDDGSTDGSAEIIERLAQGNGKIFYQLFSRNFGKEIATSAGLQVARGQAALMLDGDLQHPVELIPEFIARWEAGAEVVVGVRKTNQGQGLIKRVGSWVFYKIMKHIAEIDVTPNATDYRLITRPVIDAFNRFTERNRMTRALIDWLGFKRDYIYFDASPRAGGAAGYSFKKLLHLATVSFVSLSLFPLKLAGYLGVIIMVVATLGGGFMALEKYGLHDLWRFDFSGTGLLAMMILFLVGVMLACLGLIALYIAHIHSEVLNRPLYVVRKNNRS